MDDLRRQRRFAAVFCGVGLLAMVIALLVDRSGSSDTIEVVGQAPAEATSDGAGDAIQAVAEEPAAQLADSQLAATGALPSDDGAIGDLSGNEALDQVQCTIDSALGVGNTGEPVVCLQNALRAGGYLTGGTNGEFDGATDVAVRKLQEERELFVDGVAGRETAISLGIWPDETANVVRTPVPPEETLDSTGYYLSTVASMGDGAPPLPPDSGSGRRVVYERAGQRVWAVEENGSIVRSWLVSGSKYGNETPGTYQVYSKSLQTTAWNGAAVLDKMVRYLKTDIGHIGFHAIPRHVDDGSVYQTEAELGNRLSGGCQRQTQLDAAFLYAWADIGTTVVVI